MKKKKLPFLKTGVSAILYLVNPHRAEPKVPWVGALRSILPPGCGRVPSTGREALAGPCADGVWVRQSPSFSWSLSLNLSSSSVVQCAVQAKLHR